MSFFERFRSDRGASMILVAMSLLLLLGASAIAVDLSAMRLDRSADQKVTDSAASAGALAVLEGTGQDGCVAALEYVAINAQEIGSVDTSDCATEFSSTCTPGEKMTVSAGSRFQITVTYPVEHADPLMTSAQLGAPTQPLHPDDGEPCERVGVEMNATHTSLFAQLLGFDQGTTTVHSVARAFEPPPDGPPLNLAVLDRTGCDAIHVTGAPGSGVFVKAVVEPDSGDVFPGTIVADSNALSPLCSTAVINVEGSNVSLQADGPPGCPDELDTGPGDGCGSIQVVADNPTPPCSPPACTAGGGNQPDPAPAKRENPITRAQIDYEYNCWGDYENPPLSVQWASPPLVGIDQWYIEGCSTGTPAHIYNLINEVGPAPSTPSGFKTWTGDLGLDCTIETGDIGPINEDVHVDCAHLVLKRHAQIIGNVVFDGHVTVEGSSGHLDIHNSLSTPGWAFFRGGTLTKKGRGILTFDYTTVYMAQGSKVLMEATPGAGRITWRAPDSGRFDDLALWSDSSVTQRFAGQNQLTMVGVFFMPWATAEYQGSSGQNQTDAQWVAHRLLATGGAALVVTPKFEFPFKVDSVPRTTIIR
jgi:hypothetical protein